MNGRTEKDFRLTDFADTIISLEGYIDSKMAKLFNSDVNWMSGISCNDC